MNVFINDTLAGELSFVPNGVPRLQYEVDWIRSPDAVPLSLSLPIREQAHTGDPLQAYLENLLPQDLNIRKRLAALTAADGHDPVSLLAKLGRDCAGSVQFLAHEEHARDEPFRSESLPERELAEMLDCLDSYPLGIKKEADFRIALAGEQRKTALLREGGSWFKPSELTCTTHILKPQIGQLPNGIDLTDSVDNEFVCLGLLAALGIPTANADVIEVGTIRALAVERFDRGRDPTGRLYRLPQEDICQALAIPSSRKYQSDGGPGVREIIELLKRSDEPNDVATFLRTIIIFWLIGATDGHAKNFSIFLLPDGRFRLAPIYDVLSAQPSLDRRQISKRQFRLAMSVGANNHYRVDEIMPRHFLQLADIAEIPRLVLESIFSDLLQDAVNSVGALSNDIPPNISPQVVESILNGLLRRVRLLEDSFG